MDPIAGEPTEERENDMSSLAVGFSLRMRKRAASAQGETTPSFEVLGSKHLKRSSLNDEVQRSPTLVALDSPEQTSAVEVGDKTLVEDDLTRVQDATVVAKEARCKAKAKFARREVEQTLLVLEIGATQDEVSSL